MVYFQILLPLNLPLGVETHPVRVIRFIAGDIMGAIVFLLLSFILWRNLG